MFLAAHGCNILIQKYFSEEWFIILHLIKAKQWERIQLPHVFLKLYMNQFSNVFLILLHFLGLWNLQSVTWRMVSMLFLTFPWKWMVSMNSLFLLLNHYKFERLFTFSQWLKRHKRSHKGFIISCKNFYKKEQQFPKKTWTYS